MGNRAVLDYTLGAVDYAKHDYESAAEYFRKAAERGYIEAQFNLGVLYASGEGVSRDMAEAERWVKRAADSGDKIAAELLKAIRKLR